MSDETAKPAEVTESAPTAASVEDMYMKFISVMVHEIRKPMTSIRGYVDMLDKRLVGELNDMQGQFVSTVRNNVLSMEQLVTDISDISKLRAGRLKAEPKMDVAKNVLLEVEKKLSELATQRQHAFVFDIPQGLPILNVDKTRYTQAIIKIVDNAIKYTNPGGTIRITASAVPEGLQVLVEDNGVGMQPEELNRLGELFFRGDDEIVLNTKGYGLGIPITMECVKLCGGRLFYSSEKGIGSKFGIIVPAMS
ncbi:MAG: HAMP domain-containing histidine kinase [Chloroflexi bacterium]|nr:HAMP domain-containing histidine kinase [Chloroflexota bacterium]